MSEEQVTDEILDAIDALCVAASPGPWFAEACCENWTQPGHDTLWSVASRDKKFNVVEVPRIRKLDKQDAELIAAARTFLPLLASTVRGLRWSLENSRSEIEVLLAERAELLRVRRMLAQERAERLEDARRIASATVTCEASSARCEWRGEGDPAPRPVA